MGAEAKAGQLQGSSCNLLSRQLHMQPYMCILQLGVKQQCMMGAGPPYHAQED